MLAAAVSSCPPTAKGGRSATSSFWATLATASAELDACEEKQELVPAQPRHRVAASDRLGQPLGHRLQDLIALLQAEGVVDDLEPVEPDEHHREHLTRAPATLYRLRQSVMEENPVGQAGQRVVIG